jgi:hypothetical protein
MAACACSPSSPSVSPSGEFSLILARARDPTDDGIDELGEDQLSLGLA